MENIGIWYVLGSLVVVFLVVSLIQRGKRRRWEIMQNRSSSLPRKVRYNPSDLQPGIRIGNWKLVAIAIFFILLGLGGLLFGYFPAQAANFWYLPVSVGILMFIFIVK